MGLELTALSHELRGAERGYDEEADMLERLGSYMWAETQRVLPGTASACGINHATARDRGDWPLRHVLLYHWLPRRKQMRSMLRRFAAETQITRP